MDKTDTTNAISGASGDIRFQIELDDGRVAECWQAASQPYADCEFSAGLVEGIPPDTIYMRMLRDDGEDWLIYLRPDEAQALAWLLNGALWSQSVMQRHEVLR